MNKLSKFIFVLEKLHINNLQTQTLI